MNSFGSIPYKQTQSFGLSTESLTGDFVNKNKFPNYKSNGDFQKQNIFGAHSLNYKYQTESISTFGSLIGSFKYTGGVYYNGFIYSPPVLASDILKINTRLDTVSTFGSVTGQYRSIGISSNDIIYSAPYTATRILRIDPSNDSISLIGPTFDTSAKWYGQVTAPNGKIYCVPANDTRIMVIDPTTETIEFIGNFSGSLKWNGAVVHGNYIYFVPWESTSILKLNWKDHTWTTFGNLIGSIKWIGGVIGKDMMIYFCPYTSNSVLKINPFNGDEITFITASSGYAGAVTSANKSKIYFMPYQAANVGSFDIETQTWSTFGIIGGTSDRCIGGILAENGSIYSIPHSITVINKILTPLNENLDYNFVMNNNFNKF